MPDRPTSDHTTSDQAPALPAPDPWVQDDARPFWDATTEHRFVLPHCASCDLFIWYPRGFCPGCGTCDVDWVEVPGTGTVYASSVPRRGQGAYAEAAPYVFAYVEVDLPATHPDTPGPRIITNIVGCDPEDVRIGDRVQAVFHDTASGHALIRFEPVTP